MDPDPQPWISALRSSHDRLVRWSTHWSPTGWRPRPWPTEWTVAQVLSHLGSQAEIFGDILDAARWPGRPTGTGRVSSGLGRLECQESGGPGGRQSGGQRGLPGQGGGAFGCAARCTPTSPCSGWTSIWSAS